MFITTYLATTHNVNPVTALLRDVRVRFMSNGTMVPIYFPELAEQDKDPEREEETSTSMSLLYMVFIIEIFVMAVILSNGGEQYDRFKWSVSRMISRVIGTVSSMPLPPYLRSLFYHIFSQYMGIKLNELPAGTDLDQFSTFNQFFTR